MDPELEKLLELEDPTPAQERRLEAALADILPTREESWTPPAELTELFLARQRAIRARLRRQQAAARRTTWLRAQLPGTGRLC
jgi:hypothetical protein